MNAKRGSGKSMLAAWHNDDDEYSKKYIKLKSKRKQNHNGYIYIYTYIYIYITIIIDTCCFFNLILCYIVCVCVYIYIYIYIYIYHTHTYIQTDACKMKKNFLLPVTFLLGLVRLFTLSIFPLLFFTSSICLTTWTNCLLQNLAKFTDNSATGVFIYEHQSLHIWALSNIIPEPIKRPNWMRGWKRMDALFLSRTSSVPGSISSLWQRTAWLMLFYHKLAWWLPHTYTGPLI